jgi:hypothetical protein
LFVLTRPIYASATARLPLKKATKPLALDLRAGGYLIYPVVRAFHLKSNVWHPSDLALEAGLTEPLAAWAADAYFRLECLNIRIQSERNNFYYSRRHFPEGAYVFHWYFVPRLTSDKVDKIIERVIRNAERLNADDDRSFTVESLGIFGSGLQGTSEPGDVDVVFTARWRETGEPLPEHSYHPLGRGGEPTDDVSSALQPGSRVLDLSPHYLLEVQRLGVPYRIIWTRAEGRVSRQVTQPSEPAVQEGPAKFFVEDGRELEQTNSLVDSFRSKCQALAPLTPPQTIEVPESTKPMTRSKWLAALESDHPVVELAHMLCLPEGELKEKLRAYIEDAFAEDPGRERKARRDLYPYLAASKLYGQWDWHAQDGLVRRKAKKEKA